MKLLETIRCEDGVCAHLPYHQKRFEKALRELFHQTAPQLHTLLNPPKEGIFRCRITYSSSSFEVEYIPYQTSYQNSFVIVPTDISYNYKYFDRSYFDTMKKKYETEPIFLKDDLISDTTVANIAIFIENQWVTPRRPLLEGTTRARLIDEKKLFLADIETDMLFKASKIAMMNALTGFYELKDAKISTQFL